MKILLIDTCGAQGSVAIADTGYTPAKIASATLPGRSASEKLVGAVRSLAEQSGITLRDLAAIAVVNGPGSFTGVRVGLSAAKGLCEALDVPLLAISRLTVLASLAGAEPGVRVVAVLDAGRGEFYVGEYLDGVKVREALVTREELAVWAGALSLECALVVCESNVAEALTTLGPQMLSEPDAVAALPLAVVRLGREDFDDIATTDANYLRRTDLEIFAKVKASQAIPGDAERRPS